MKTLARFFLLFALLSPVSPSFAKPDLPNIVVILSDDYGYGSATCYGADPHLIRTPNIDRLATEGRRFTDANTTSSVCSPTRYSLLTGRYCWRTSLKNEVLSTTSPLHIEPGRLNLASLLKKHGYRTAAIGKWHLGYGSEGRTDFTRELKPGPLEIGFDYHFGVPANHGDISGVYVENHGVAGLRSDKLSPGETGVNFKGAPYLGLDAPHRVDEEVMPHLTDKTVEWIEQQSSDHPFFLYYTPVAVHNPVTPSKNTAGTSKAGPYGDWIHELDASVGGVLDALDRKGFTGNTLVLFTADNGGVNKPGTASESSEALEAGLTISGPFRGGKHDVWNGGFRVPYLVRWPGHVPAGSVCDEPLSLADTLATVAAVVGEDLPPKDQGAEDSYDMLPAWLGAEHDSPIRPDLILHSADANFAIRRGRWKWIEGDFHPETRAGSLKIRADQYKPQLYDLESDIAETTEVSRENPEVVKELSALLERYRQGGYSRELPPPSPAAPPVEPLSPVVGKTVRSDALKTVPEAPWVKVRGRWIARDKSLVGSQTGGERGVAAMRCPLQLADCDIRYEVSLPQFGTTHSLRLAGSRPDHVFLVHVSNRFLSIGRQPTEDEPPGGIEMDTARLRVSPGEWVKLRIHLEGDEIAAQAGDAVVRARDPIFSQNKTAFAFLVSGTGAAFRNLVVTDPAGSE